MEIDLTQAASEEVDRIVKLTGLTPRMVWQKSFNLFRAYLEACARGEAWVVYRPECDIFPTAQLGSTSEENLQGYSRVVVPGINF
jgi:hypothetical protein